MGLSEKLLERQIVGEELQPFPPFSCPLLEVQSSQTIKYLKDSGLGMGWQNKGNKRTLSSVQFSSVAQLCPTLCNPKDCSTPGLPVHHQLLEFTQTHDESVMPSNHLILCCPLLLCLQSFPASGSFPMNQLFALGGQIRIHINSVVFLPKTHHLIMKKHQTYCS